VIVGLAAVIGTVGAAVGGTVLPASGASAADRPTCVHPKSGLWTGPWTATNVPEYNTGTFQAQLHFARTPTRGTYAISGSVTISGSVLTVGGAVTGTVTCGDGAFGTVNNQVEFTDTLFSAPRTISSGSFSVAEAVGPTVVGTFAGAWLHH
jgi:hypothetical protein